MPNQNTEKSRRVEIETETGSSLAALSEGLTQVFNEIDDLVSVWDSELRLIFCNDAFKSIRTTIDTSTIIGKARWEFDGPAKNDDDFWRDHKAVIARGDAIVNFEFPYFNSNGQTGFSRINGSPILNDDGARLGFRGTAMDITETRKRQQHILNLPAAMDAMPEAVAVYDAEDKVIFTNQAYRKLNTNIDGKLNEGEIFEEVHRMLLDRGLAAEAKLGCISVFCDIRLRLNIPQL
jgi:PAS domain S-box-containing protein